MWGDRQCLPLLPVSADEIIGARILASSSRLARLVSIHMTRHVDLPARPRGIDR